MTVVRKVWQNNGIHEFLQAEWTDMPDLIAGKYLPDRASNKRVFKETIAYVKPSSKQWFGGISSWSQVARFVQNGWPEGVEKAKPVLDELQVAVTGRLESIKPFWKVGDEGSYHRWERDLEGEHDVAWKRRVRRKTSGNNVVSLGVQFGGHAGVTADQYFWCGAQMAVATELLEQAGFEVEVRAYVLSHFGYPVSGTQIFEVVGKKAGDAPNINNVMALTGHVGIYRTLGFLGFASGESNDTGGWGRDVTSGQEKMLNRYYEEAPMDRYDVHMPLAYSRADAITNIRACLAKVGETAGVTIFEGAQGF